jgi:hypothetical protein
MWEETDAANLRNFLLTETGKRLKEQIAYNRPDIPLNSIEASALAAQRMVQHDIVTTLIVEKLPAFFTQPTNQQNFIDVTQE